MIDVTPAVVVAMMLGVAAPSAAADLPALLLAMETAYAGVTDYTARFSRQEWVGGALRPREEAFLKFQRPGRVYLRWTAGLPKGREILYVPGRDADRILVHQPGALSGFFTLVMAPDHPRVLKESRAPHGVWSPTGNPLDIVQPAARIPTVRSRCGGRALGRGNVVKSLGAGVC